MFSKHTFGARTYSTGLARTDGHRRKSQGEWGPPLTKQWRAAQNTGRCQAEAARAAKAVAERAVTTRLGRW